MFVWILVGGVVGLVWFPITTVVVGTVGLVGYYCLWTDNNPGRFSRL
jgi:hypothetical protein